MEKINVEKLVKEIIVDRLDVAIEKVTPDALLSKDIGMDSFGAVELTFELKDRFGIEIPQEDFSKIKKVKDVVEYIYDHLKGG